MTPFVLEIITPDGKSFVAEDIEQVVFRRREHVHEQGSEVALFPLHGPLLMRIPCTPVRYSCGGEIRHLVLGGGFVQVKGSKVLCVTPRFQAVGVDSPEARNVAKRIADQWLAEATDFIGSMTGFK
ncbi:MAG: hypothetical protein OEV43_00070 [Coriobacteriia bacterium]|nr:hypothetical protein [Coriobacteriia bacterium]